MKDKYGRKICEKDILVYYMNFYRYKNGKLISSYNWEYEPNNFPDNIEDYIKVASENDVSIQTFDDENVRNIFNSKIKPGVLVLYQLNKDIDNDEIQLGMMIGTDKVLSITGKVSTPVNCIPILYKDAFYVRKEKIFIELMKSSALKSGNKSMKTSVGTCVNTKTGVYVYIGDFNLELITQVRLQLHPDFDGKKKYYVRIADNVEDLLLKYENVDKLDISYLKQIIEKGGLKLGDAYTSKYALSNLIALQNNLVGVGGYGGGIDLLSFGTLEAFKKASTLSKFFTINNDTTLDYVSFYDNLVTVSFK